jgi:neutral ceramidase
MQVWLGVFPGRWVALLLGLCLAGCPQLTGAGETFPWKAGVAVQSVTPPEMIWMAGYASRNKPAEGVAQDLFAKAVVLEDPTGSRLLIITLDLIGVPRHLREFLETELAAKHGLRPDQILLNASHTHCGPVLHSPKGSFYSLDAEQLAKVIAYMDRLKLALVDLTSRAIADLAPSKLGYTHARCGVSMNRRLPTPTGFQNSPYPDGPVDQSVPVLRVTGAEGQLRAVLFGYACHNTTLGFFEFCGDYAGFAQADLEAAHPDAVALFVMGCGGDQNPYPRGNIENAKQHGRALANAVEVGLLVAPTEILPPLATAYATPELAFAPAPSQEALTRLAAAGTGYEHQHARRLLDRIEREGSLPMTYKYPIQVIRFGRELTLATLAGEVVVDYSLRLKRELPGERVWVAGYSNDVFGYVPSHRVLKEGGYEGGGAMLYTNLPGPFADDVEDRIFTGLKGLLDSTAQTLEKQTLEKPSQNKQ